MEKLLSFGATDLLGSEVLSYSLTSQESQFLACQTINTKQVIVCPIKRERYEITHRPKPHPFFL